MVEDGVVRRVRQEVFELAAQGGERPRHRQLVPPDLGEPGFVQVDQPDRFALPRLGKRVRQRAAGVAQVLGERLRAVEVAERHVVDAVEDRAGHLLDAADRDRAFGVGRLAAGDERVREHDRPDARAGSRGPRGSGAWPR